MKKLLSVLLAAAMLAAFAPMALAAPELTLIIASNQTDLTNPYSYGLDKFKEVAEKLSGGKIEVVVHKGTLGENESELVEKLTMGAADLVVSSPGFMTAIGVPEIDIFSLEYLFDSFEHWEKCLDGEFGTAMKDIVLEKTGNQFRIMGYWSSSVRDVYAKKPVKTPEDMKGLKIRIQSAQVQQAFFKARSRRRWPGASSIRRFSRAWWTARRTTTPTSPSRSTTRRPTASTSPRRTMTSPPACSS